MSVRPIIASTNSSNSIQLAAERVSPPAANGQVMHGGFIWAFSRKKKLAWKQGWGEWATKDKIFIQNRLCRRILCGLISTSIPIHLTRSWTSCAAFKIHLSWEQVDPQIVGLSLLMGFFLAKEKKKGLQNNAGLWLGCWLVVSLAPLWN